MEETMYSRTELLIGKEGIDKLKKSKVAVFGIGGVGSYVCEGLVRAGIGNFILIDNDKIVESNINRQIHATYDTIGKSKVEAEKERILMINPKANVKVYEELYLPENKTIKINNEINYIVDAMDMVSAKISIIEEAQKMKIPIISCMGTGNKLNPTKFEITKIEKTSVCPLAKVMRRELKERNLKNVKVLYSKEEPVKINQNENMKRVNGTISFVPSVAGLIIAGEVINDLLKDN